MFFYLDFFFNFQYKTEKGSGKGVSVRFFREREGNLCGVLYVRTREDTKVTAG